MSNFPSQEDLVDVGNKANLDALATGTRCNLHTPYAIEVQEYASFPVS